MNFFSQGTFHLFLSLAALTSSSIAEGISLGETIYHRAALCASCHQADGKGTPDLYPPLAQSPWVTGDPDRLIKLVLIGMDGEIEIQGRTYGGTQVAAMAGFRETIPSDHEMAALLTYIRQEWGNRSSAITPEQVAAVKLQLTDRYDYWTPEELLALHPMESSATEKLVQLPEAERMFKNESDGSAVAIVLLSSVIALSLIGLLLSD